MQAAAPPAHPPRFASDPDIARDSTPDASGPVSGRRTAHAPGLIVAGKYQLLRPLGAGGMGEVWVAHHLNLDIDVAVKFIGDAGAPESALSERLLEEARNTARLGHPAIVRALDFGHTERAEPFIVLELLAGIDLATRLEQTGALAAEQAVALLLPIVNALSAVHESGIVHRDIKPENVFLTEGDLGVQAKLLDFGIAHKTDRVQRFTMRDTALGTPDYMSPEQARGESTDAATDQWSFCVVLFEVVARRRPFQGDNYHSLLRSIIDDAPQSLLSVGVEEPELWDIVGRGLEKAPGDRHASMRDLGEALARWLLDRGVQEDAVGTSLRRAWLKDGSAPVSSSNHPPSIAALEAPVARAPAAPAPDASVSLGLPPTSSDGHGPVLLALEEALKPPSEQHSAPDLAALADLHRGGDPEERLRRDATRRVLVTLLVLVVGVVASALSILVATGVIVW